jgi:Cu(I)/Ag(I) efflux system membrane fusion protein
MVMKRQGEKMKTRGRSTMLVAAIAATFVAGFWYGQHRALDASHPAGREDQARVDLVHADHAAHTSDAASDVGMHDHAHHAHGGQADSAGSSPASVTVSAEQQQLIGVRVSPVERASGTHTLRLFGRVAPDETRVYKLNAGIEGAIREVSPVTTGSQVKKDQLLATFAAPNAASVIHLYMVNTTAAGRARAGDGATGSAAHTLAAANIQQRIDQLLSVGMSKLQMEEIARTGEYPEGIKVLAPANGFVLARNVSPGQTFEKGAEFFRIADLSRVWIVADVFERDAQHLRPGVRAEVSLPNQGTKFAAKVTEVLPQFDAASRTLKVRFEADNPGFRLRPDMLVDVSLQVTLAEALGVPVDAVVDSGLKKTVFVERTAGVFEAREVQVGRRSADRIEIASGLTAGERIVVSGTFFLDSETRMKLAAERIQSASAAGSGAKPDANSNAHAGHSHHAH